MTKRLYNTSYYEVRSAHGNDYGVVLERIKNDRNGNPRYKAGIIYPRQGIMLNYNFTGHYDTEYNEAKWIVDYHERTTVK